MCPAGKKAINVYYRVDDFSLGMSLVACRYSFCAGRATDYTGWN